MKDPSIAVHWYSHPARIPPSAWELPGAQQACISMTYLSAMQDSAPDYVKGWHYATAHAAGQDQDDGRAGIVGLLVCLVIEAVEEELLGPAPLRLFVLSDAMGMCRPPLLTSGRSEAERARITQALLDAAIQRAHGEQAEGVHVYWIGEGNHLLRDSLAARGFLPIPEDPCAHVPLLARETGPYPEVLRGSYRSVLKRKRQLLTERGLSLRSEGERPDAGLLDALYQKVAERKEEERWEIVESRFPRRFFKLALSQPAFRLSVCEMRDGTLLGYLLGICCGDTFVSLAVGLDYDRIDEVGAQGLAAATFLCLHAEAMTRAQAEGARWAVLGISALEGKARAGALCERNFGMGLGLSERASEALRFAQGVRAAADSLPACRPYSETALVHINREAACRGVVFTAPAASDAP